MAKQAMSPEQRKAAMQSMMGIAKEVHGTPEEKKGGEEPKGDPEPKSSGEITASEEKNSEKSPAPIERSQKAAKVRETREFGLFTPPVMEVPKTQEMMLELLNLTGYWKVTNNRTNVSVDDAIVAKMRVLAEAGNTSLQNMISSILSSWIYANTSELEKIMKEYQKGLKI